MEPAQEVNDEQSNAQYYELRKAALQKLQEKGVNIYPHKFDVSMEHALFKKKYDHLGNSEEVDGEVVSLAGRIVSKRSASSKLFFYNFSSDGTSLQIMANFKAYGTPGDKELSFEEINDVLRRGDIVGVVGTPARSKSGELSIMAHKLILLSPCYHNLPHPNKLTDTETRHRNRHLDMIVNDKVIPVFKMRAKIIAFIRRFFNDRDYIEVETPTMSIIPGGATAKPFITHLNDLHTNMFMRIAPELYLKQLIVGGMNRIYEIGKCYRNETNDTTHNCEFLSIESYTFGVDYLDLMEMTEELLSSMVKELTGGYVIPCTHKKTGAKCEVDFTPPFRRFPMIETLEKELDVKFPTDLASDETTVFLKELLKKVELECEPPLTTPRMLDALTGKYIESQLLNPGFITCHPVVMSPLAKRHRSLPGLTERFELFINFFEICNSYTEQNNPFEQREAFSSQQKDKDAGDDEAQPTDEHFCVALEHALGPTGGWGMGIDRLCMLLTGQTSIREVILFPMMKPLEEDRKAQRQMKGIMETTLASMAKAATLQDRVEGL